ncbi:MAG: type IX secretion system membrane protein PorP/SprF [Cyclobacteriaceae bacterium]|nr:type IX secretion system membrane protein PorP/SprF [Cyclobacteriaceae bacterium]
MKRFIFIILLFNCLTSWAQDPHFSQFYASPLYLNPAFAGTVNNHRLIAHNRLQWPVLSHAYTTYSFSYDHYRSDLKSGFGLLFNADKAGSAGLKTNMASFIYSYKIRMPGKWVLTPGLSFTYGNRGLDYSKLVLGDQLSFGNSNAPSIDPALMLIDSRTFFDSSTGILFYNKATWLGASWAHINRPNISILETEDRLPAKFTFHGGTRIQFYGGPASIEKISYLTTSFIVNVQGPFSQMDMGVNYHVDPILVGVWYRGIAFKENAASNRSRDALILSAGLQYSMFSFQYSYDFTISELGTGSQGAHELSLEYRFDFPSNPKRVKRSDKILPCPSFIPTESYRFRK